jgi:hypothetical protein
VLCYSKLKIINEAIKRSSSRKCCKLNFLYLVRSIKFLYGIKRIIKDPINNCRKGAQTKIPGIAYDEGIPGTD